MALLNLCSSSSLWSLMVLLVVSMSRTCMMYIWLVGWFMTRPRTPRQTRQAWRFACRSLATRRQSNGWIPVNSQKVSDTASLLSFMVCRIRKYSIPRFHLATFVNVFSTSRLYGKFLYQTVSPRATLLTTHEELTNAWLYVVSCHSRQRLTFQ